MICTACNKPIESGEFRYHTTKDAHLPQHRQCSESDPQWGKLDAEQSQRTIYAKETLEDMKRIQARGFWDVSDDIEEIESIMANAIGEARADSATSLHDQTL